MTKFKPNEAHIVYASDDKFAEILGVSLISLFENSKDMDGIVVYILDSGVSAANKEKLISIFDAYKRTGVFIPATDISKKMSMEIELDRGSLSQYARLFVSSDLPADLDRVLYLDCDIIIRKSIKELWNLNLHGNVIGALMDAFSKHYRANVDLHERDVMFNSGVMLIDLEKWKAEHVEDKLIKFIKSKNGKIQQGDQGALNAVLSKDTYCFEPRFNSVTIYYDFTYEEMLIYRKPPAFYKKEQVEEAVKKPTIIHFTTSFLSKRPWIEGCEHIYTNEWIKYKNISPWKGTALWKENRPGWKLLGAKVISALPRGVAIRVAGLLQAYWRPLKNRMIK